jgi:hypothetical protein
MSFLAARYWSQHNAEIKAREKIALGHEALLLRVTAIEAQLGLLNQAVIPISTAFQGMLVQQLGQAHMPRLDELLTKIGPPNKMTGTEEKEFHELLHERAEDRAPGTSQTERSAAAVLPEVMVMAGLEQAALHPEQSAKANVLEDPTFSESGNNPEDGSDC